MMRLLREIILRDYYNKFLSFDVLLEVDWGVFNAGSIRKKVD